MSASSTERHAESLGCEVLMSNAGGPKGPSDSENPEPRSDESESPTLDFDAALEGRALDVVPKDPAASWSMGRYRLVRKLGEGGMGQVWLARQSAPLQRQVALKLIRAGLYDDALLQRFLAERQSLAMMDHPAIAKVFDAGTTPEGQPYFVMEYVPGKPITSYCDDRNLGIRERLELFLTVCEGVQHAHQKAVIHRDLKPANILVLEVDGKPTARIIDFGLAKATTPRAGGGAAFTRAGGIVGTPAYMSPEQADPGILDVDTRADVYSLGVVLYVLLTGMLPVDPDSWQKKPLDEMLRALREEDPPSPSARVRTEKNAAATAAERRGTEATQLARTLRGDLDWITMKAVEKDRARRYGTPSELAADIERYLHDLPVAARPPSAAYQLGKYVRRHRVGAAMAVGTVALGVGFAIAQSVQLERVTRERDRANRVTEFMLNMFEVSDPSESRGKTITAREILDKAAANIDSGLAQDPEVRTQLMHLMGSVYQRLGLYSRSQPLLEQAAAVQTRVLGPEKRETLASTGELAWTLDHEGKYEQAESLERRVLESERRVLGPEDKATLGTMNNLSWTLLQRGHSAEAEQLDREAIAIERRVVGPDDTLTLAAMSILGVTLSAEKKYPEAEAVQRETLARYRRVRGPDHPDTLQVMDNLATTLNDESRFPEAETLERETLAIERRVLGPAHPSTAETIDNLATTLLHESRYADAERLQREALDLERRMLGPEHPDTLITMRNVAVTLDMEGHLDEGERLARETLAIQQRVLGPGHPQTLQTMGYFPILYKQRHQYAKAEQAERQILDVEQRYLGAESPATLSTMNSVALTCLSEGNAHEAETMFVALREIQRRVLGPDDPATAGTTYNLACVAAKAGWKEQALSLLQDAMTHGLGADVAQGIEKDADLASLRNDPRFTALAARAKR